MPTEPIYSPVLELINVDEKYLGDYPINGLDPASFHVIAKPKPDDIVTMVLQYDLQETSIILSDKAQTHDEKNYIALKTTDEAEIFEIDSKKLPKLLFKSSKNDNNSNSSLVLTPTIESNDTTVKVNLAFKIKGKLGGVVSQFPPGVKLPIIQKIQGEYIIGGVDADSFRILIKEKKDQYGSKIGVTAIILFDVKNAKVNDWGDTNPGWKELLEAEKIIHLPFKLNTSPELNVKVASDYSENGSNDLNLNAAFSFSVINSNIIGLASGGGGGSGGGKVGGSASADFS